jgi:hypothetical protein
MVPDMMYFTLIAFFCLFVLFLLLMRSSRPSPEELKDARSEFMSVAGGRTEMVLRHKSDGRTVRLRRRVDFDADSPSAAELADADPPVSAASDVIETPSNARVQHKCMVCVVDTSAVMDDPEILLAHPGATMVVPRVAFRELGSIKSSPRSSELQRRQAQRAISTIEHTTGWQRPLDAGRFLRPEGGELWIFDEEVPIPKHLDARIPDHVIVAVAAHFNEPGRQVRLYSSDKEVLVLGRLLGLTCP